MKHEVKIPSDCKATVSIEDRRILIIIDQKEDILVAGPKSFELSQENLCKLAGMEGGVIRGSANLDKLTDVKKKAWEELDRKINSSIELGAIRKPNEAGEYVVGTIFENKKESAPKGNLEAHCDSGEGDSIGVLSLVKDGRVQTSINLDKLTDSEKKAFDSLDLRRHITLPEIDAIKLGCDESPFPLYFRFVTSERGDIAISNGEFYPVILTCNGEIQLNQTCNFSFIGNSTIEEEKNLIEALRLQKSLMWDGEKLINWVPRMGETYLSFDFDCTQMALEYSGRKVDVLLAKAGNVFPVGFLTEEKISQFKKTIMDLFDSWRQ